MDKRVPWQLGRIYSDEVNVIVWAQHEGQARDVASSWAADPSYLDPGSVWCRELDRHGGEDLAPVVGKP